MKNRKPPKTTTKLDEEKPDAILDKHYITSQVETSITLLESPEKRIVLESLMYLSKYADIQTNNLHFLQQNGILPKLLQLLDLNICILRLSLRLLDQLLNIDASLDQIGEEKYNESILKISHIYIEHEDSAVKLFSISILAKYADLDNKAKVLLQNNKLLNALVDCIKISDVDMLDRSLQLFSKLMEEPVVIETLAYTDLFDIEDLLSQMNRSESCFDLILGIIEKITYLGEGNLLEQLRRHKLVEYMFELIIKDSNDNNEVVIDPSRILRCLSVVKHCTENEITSCYFIDSIEFLKFCRWIRNRCMNSEQLEMAITILLKLTEIDSIRQILYDLSVEQTILSVLNHSEDKKTLNKALEALSSMAVHKFCCNDLITPPIIKRLLQIMSRTGDSVDSYNEIALKLIHTLARRDQSTIHILNSENGTKILLERYLANAANLTDTTYGRVIELISMHVTIESLRKHVISTELYEILIKSLTSSDDDEVQIKAFELLTYCLGEPELREFLHKHVAQIVSLLTSHNQDVRYVRTLAVFIHSCMEYQDLGLEFIRKGLIRVLRKVQNTRVPLLERLIKCAFQLCLSVKFYETGRLEVTDRISGRFCVILGDWPGDFPFVELLEAKHISTRSVIYVVNWSFSPSGETSKTCCTVFSTKSSTMLDAHIPIKYGKLSADQYLLRYLVELEEVDLKNCSYLEDRVRVLAEFVDRKMCGSIENDAEPIHTFRLHLECLRMKLGTNLIPIGFLRLGFKIERALLFKALADKVMIPTSLVRGGRRDSIFWNEVIVARRDEEENVGTLEVMVVDLVNKVGDLMPLDSRECAAYCSR